MGNVPGTNSCPVADVVTLVPSQAAACDICQLLSEGYSLVELQEQRTGFQLSVSCNSVNSYQKVIVLLSYKSKE